MSLLFNAAIEAFLKKDLDWEADDIRAIAVDDTFVPDASSYDHLNDVPSGSRIGSAISVGGRTMAANVADCNDLALGSPAAGRDVSGVVFYLHNATESLALLILHYDDFLNAPLPTNGQAITAEIPATGLFQIGD